MILGMEQFINPRVTLMIEWPHVAFGGAPKEQHFGSPSQSDKSKDAASKQLSRCCLEAITVVECLETTVT